jgi:carnitine O-acetyltransferase
MQLAYWRWKRCFVGTYEPAHTRRFLWGRTACIRVVTQESCAAVRAIDAALSAQDRGDHTAAVVTAYRLLKAAGARHTDNARLASAGLDVDRHLLGMKLLWNDEKAKLRQKPSIDVAASKALKMEESDSPAALFFSDPLYATASTWMISTSNLSYECFDNWGWRVLSTAMGQYLLYIQRVLSTLRRGEVVPGGLGVAFCTRAQSLRFNIVAERSTNASAFVAELKRALYDMMALARSAQSTHKSVNSSGDTTSVTSARL